MTKVIAISGWKCSGKDTVADYLRGGANGNYHRLGFADALKDMVANMYGMDRRWCDDRKFKEHPLAGMPVETKDAFGEMIHEFMKKEFASVNGVPHWTPRALCILEGSVKRAAASEYWVEQVIQVARRYDKVVIPDLRYRSEVSQLEEAFGADLTTVRVNRYDVITSSDPSEHDLDDHEFDVVIDNTGSLARLYETINIKLVGE